MPQLDSATYLGQVTWFSVVFSAFYLIVLTDVLPALNRIVKVRAKKLERGRGDGRRFDGVRVSAQEALDSQASTVAKRVGSLLQAKLATVQGFARGVVLSRFVRAKSGAKASSMARVAASLRRGASLAGVSPVRDGRSGSSVASSSF